MGRAAKSCPKAGIGSCMMRQMRPETEAESAGGGLLQKTKPRLFRSMAICSRGAIISPTRVLKDFRLDLGIYMSTSLSRLHLFRSSNSHSMFMDGLGQHRSVKTASNLGRHSRRRRRDLSGTVKITLCSPTITNAASESYRVRVIGDGRPRASQPSSARAGKNGGRVLPGLARGRAVSKSRVRRGGGSPADPNQDPRASQWWIARSCTHHLATLIRLGRGRHRWRGH